MASMQTSDVTLDGLHRLATLEAPGDARILSLYLNLDPESNFGARANRHSATTSLMDEAARAVEGQEDLGHDAHVALREDVTRAREALDQNLDDGWAEGAHALGMFVSGPAGLFDVVRLPRPVPNRVVIAGKPAIEPLAEAGPVEPWAVLVLDGNDARLLQAHGDRLEELEHDRTDVFRSRRASTGPLHYDRPVGMEELDFLRTVADKVRLRDEQARFRRLVIGATERHYAELLRLFPKALSERVIGRFDAGADWENAQQIRNKIEPLLMRDETRRESDALAKARYPGVRGLSDTLPALYERRVETFLFEPGLERRGVVCPRCNWASADDVGTCPVDGVETKTCENVVEWAVEMAVEQDAGVMAVRHHNDLADHDGIGAVLRYTVTEPGAGTQEKP